MTLDTRRLLLAGVFLIGAAAFTPTAWAQDSASNGDAAASAAKLSPPPAGKAQIVFYRTFAPGAALGFTIHEGDANIAKIGTNSYMVFTAEPGAHTYAIKSEATDTLKLELDAGETYYVKQTMTMGLLVGRPHLVLSDEAAFLKAGGTKLRISKWTDPSVKSDQAKAPDSKPADAAATTDAKPADPKPMR